jgi:hypothetical protein
MHFRWSTLIVPRVLAGIALVAAIVRLPIENASGQQVPSPKKPKHAVAQAAGPNSVSQDFGNIAVLVDNGLMVTSSNPLDLDGVGVQFTPVGNHAFSVASGPAALDGAFGPALTFGYPQATLFPGDDDTQQVPFPAGFPFFGTVYTSVWVNTDGNVTFGAPEFASDDRDKSKHVLGPPRISALLFDVNPFNAFNPPGVGTIHAVAKTNPDRLVVTWNEVGDFEGPGTSTFQITLYASGGFVFAIDHIDPAVKSGVSGLAEGGGLGPINNVDLSGSTPVAGAGAIMEGFSLYTQLNHVQTAREFYKTHPDKFDFLTIFTEFPADGCCYSNWVSNKTHGISSPLNRFTGEPIFATSVFDRSQMFGSSGELEQVVFMANAPELAYPSDLVNPPVVPYSTSLNIIQIGASQGFPVTFDGQTMTQVRAGATLLPDDGEFSRLFLQPHGQFYVWTNSLMASFAHEVEHRWGFFLRFVHPITGGNGLDAYDLIGRDLHHWSYFVNTTVPASQFGGVPRSAALEGNALLDLGPIAEYNGTPTNLLPGERVFLTAPDSLMDGFNEVDQYIMGVRKANEVGAFWYVDDPKSIYTGQSLDVFNPANPLDASETMRVWLSQGGIAFKGKRVDLTLEDVKDYEKGREGSENPHGKRFWGPKNNLTVRYFSSTGQVDPAGDATVVLSANERELGDEADMIDAQGKPVDVKTMAFILVVKQGDPSSYGPAMSRLDAFRQVWEAYGNGPASAGRGKFDTRLNPPIY